MKWTPSKGQVSAARRAYVRNAETKYFDVGINVDVTAAGTDWANSEVPCDNYVNSSGVAAAYTDSCLIPTANGSGYGQVIGNKYNLKKLRVRGMLQIATQSDAADVGSPVTARIMLVRDKQPNGAQAQGEDVMQDLGAFGENAFSFMRVADNVGRFEIIKECYLTFSPDIYTFAISKSIVSNSLIGIWVKEVNASAAMKRHLRANPPASK